VLKSLKVWRSHTIMEVVMGSRRLLVLALAEDLPEEDGLAVPGHLQGEEGSLRRPLTCTRLP
jgi:hypothetical protein